MNPPPSHPRDLLTPSEVAAILSVDPKTVTRWAIAGKVKSFRTPGGHRRFLRSEIDDLLTDVNHSPDRPLEMASGYTASFPPGLLRADSELHRADGLWPAGYPQAATAAAIAEAVAFAREMVAAEAAQAVSLIRDIVAAAADRAADADEAARVKG